MTESIEQLQARLAAAKQTRLEEIEAEIEALTRTRNSANAEIRNLRAEREDLTRKGPKRPRKQKAKAE